MKWLRRKQVADKLGVSDSHLRTSMEKMPGFPQPIKISPMLAVYDEEEVDNWMMEFRNKRVNAEAQSEGVT